MTEVNDQIFLQIYKNIDKDIELADFDSISEDELKSIISARVEYLLENDKDLLMSYLYRLDVPHEKVQLALRYSHEIPLSTSIGLLIYYRQLERVRTKIKFKQPNLGEEWDAWH